MTPTPQVEQRVRKLHDNSRFAEGFNPEEMDWLDEIADEWMAETGVQNMLDAMASIAIAKLPDDLAKRTREGLATIAHQCFVEGAIRIAEPVMEANARLATHLATLTAERDALREALEPFALAILPHVDDDHLIDTVAWTAGQHRKAAAALSTDAPGTQEGE
jgi:hypothetical protein